MKKRLSALLAFILVISLISGCASAPAQSTPPADTDAVQSSAEIQSSPEMQFPLTVTDQIGNSVTLNAPARRIVSGYYISSSACMALDLADCLVGTEEKIELRPIYALAAADLIGNTANVGNAKSFDLEACIAAEPDLVILPKKARDYADTLSEMGIPAIVVSPESPEDLIEMIRLIAALTDTGEAADKLIDRYDTLLAELQSLTVDFTDADKPLVYICHNGSYMSTAPKDMYQASLVRSAGGINAGDILEGDSWTEVSYEQILAMNPDVIIIPTNNMATGQPDYTAADIMADPNLADVTAVKNGAIYNMPSGLEAWDSPVPSGVLGMLWLLNVLHPDLYTTEAFVAEATDFYATFYNFDLDAAMITG